MIPFSRLFFFMNESSVWAAMGKSSSGNRWRSAARPRLETTTVSTPTHAQLGEFEYGPHANPASALLNCCAREHLLATGRDVVLLAAWCKRMQRPRCASIELPRNQRECRFWIRATGPVAELLRTAESQATDQQVRREFRSAVQSERVSLDVLRAAAASTRASPHDVARTLAGCHFIFAKDPPPERNPQFEAHLARLREAQAQREYNAMISNLASSQDIANRQAHSELASASASTSVGINLIASMISLYLAGYFVYQWSYPSSIVGPHIAGLFASIAIMLVEFWLFVIRSTRNEKQ